MVKLPDTKNKTSRSFVINGPYLEYVEKYAALRPSHTQTDRFFIQYRNGHCTVQVIGKNSFGRISKSIARFLQLPNPEQYTGHCYRRSSATIFVDNGANTIELQRLGGWKSARVAQSYVDESMSNKIQTANRFVAAINLPSASNVVDEGK